MIKPMLLGPASLFEMQILYTDATQSTRSEKAVASCGCSTSAMFVLQQQQHQQSIYQQHFGVTT